MDNPLKLLYQNGWWGVPPSFFWNLQIHWIEKQTWISFWSQTHVLHRILVSGTLHCCLQTHVPSIPIHVSIRFHLSIPFLHFLSNVGKIIINHPFGNGLHNLFMVILGVVYSWFNHINRTSSSWLDRHRSHPTPPWGTWATSCQDIVEGFPGCAGAAFFTTLGGLAFWGMSSGAFP